MTTVFLTGGEAPPPDWCSGQEQEEEWGWGGLRNWISVWCRQKWKSLTAGGWYCFNDKSGKIYFKGDSKVYLLQKCKSLAGDFKFHVKCFEIAVQVLLWVWVKKKTPKIDIVNTGKTPLQMEQLKMMCIFLVILPYLAQNIYNKFWKIQKNQLG